ncbi:hypothetical protein R6Q59_002573 [Mikania micrantha]
MVLDLCVTYNPVRMVLEAWFWTCTPRTGFYVAYRVDMAILQGLFNHTPRKDMYVAYDTHKIRLQVVMYVAFRPIRHIRKKGWVVAAHPTTKMTTTPQIHRLFDGATPYLIVAAILIMYLRCRKRGKTMKAPGNPSTRISRAAFEKNPKGYFSSLRGHSN